MDEQKRTKRLSCHNRTASPFTTAFLNTHSNVVLSARDARLDVGLELLCQAVWPAKAHMESLHALRPALGNQLDKLGEPATKPARPLRLDLSHGAVAKVCLSNSALLVGGGGSSNGLSRQEIRHLLSGRGSVSQLVVDAQTGAVRQGSVPDGEEPLLLDSWVAKARGAAVSRSALFPPSCFLNAGHAS